MYLRYYAELAPAEIAEHLGVPLKTVKSRQTCALAALREKLDARSGGDRRAWMEAFLPLAIPVPALGLGHAAPLAGGAVQAAIGGLAVKKLVVVGVALVMALVAWRVSTQDWLRERWEASRRGDARVALRPLEAKPAELAPALAVETLEGRRPAVEAATVTTGALRLTFLRSDGTPASDMPFAIECRSEPAPRVETFRGRAGGDGTALVEGLFARSRVDLGPRRSSRVRDRSRDDTHAHPHAR